MSVLGRGPIVLSLIFGLGIILPVGHLASLGGLLVLVSSLRVTVVSCIVIVSIVDGPSTSGFFITLLRDNGHGCSLRA